MALRPEMGILGRSQDGFPPENCGNDIGGDVIPDACPRPESCPRRVIRGFHGPEIAQDMYPVRSMKRDIYPLKISAQHTYTWQS